MFLKIFCYESPLGYNNVNEVIELENKMVFYFKNTKKDIILTEGIKEDLDNNNICRFCKTETISDKVRDHCRLTAKYGGPAHNTCNINVIQQQSNIIPLLFHNFSKYDCQMFFKGLGVFKKEKNKI